MSTVRVNLTGPGKGLTIGKRGFRVSGDEPCILCYRPARPDEHGVLRCPTHGTRDDQKARRDELLRVV